MSEHPHSITLKAIEHRGYQAIGLFFPYNQLILEIAKKTGAKRSNIHKCWWLPNTLANLNNLFKAYKGVAWLNITHLPRKNQRRN